MADASASRSPTFPLMKSRSLLFWTLAALAYACVSPLRALVEPQDNWRTYPTLSWTMAGTPRTITVGADGSVYVAVEGTESTKINVYTSAGAFVRELASFGASAKVGGMDVGTDGNLYVFAGNPAKVLVYDNTGNLLRQWGGQGAGNGMFADIYSSDTTAMLALDSADNVYVADEQNHLVQKFSSNGAFLLQWGGSANLVGQFSTGNMSLGILPNDNVAVASAVNSHILQVFTSAGTVAYAPTANSLGTPVPLTMGVLPDGLIVFRRLSGYTLYDESLVNRGNLFGGIIVNGLATDLRGRIYATSYTGNVSGGTTGTVTIYERSYLVENPPVYNAPPQPTLLGSEQRPSTPYVDIDYKVVDADDATVQVALLGFLNGGDDLSKVLKLSTFVENTADHVGAAQPANQARRVTWNAAADWAVEFGDVQFEVLAKDGRGLMPVHWITVPAQGASPAVAISQRPVTEAEWLHLWYWLIATNEPGLVLADGQITAATGSHAGQILASTANNVSTTTAEGRAWLCEKLNIRAITADELARATAGQFGFSSVTELSVVKLPAATP